MNEFEVTEEEDFDPPSYSKRGWIEFEIVHIYQNPKFSNRYETELIDADLDSSVFWIQEGIGFDCFFDRYVDLDLPGNYRIEGIYGEYYRGDWSWGEDDDERWDFERVIRIDCEKHE